MYTIAKKICAPDYTLELSRYTTMPNKYLIKIQDSSNKKPIYVTIYRKGVKLDGWEGIYRIPPMVKDFLKENGIEP